MKQGSRDKGVVLVVPYRNSHYIVPPLGLGYLAAVLRREGVRVDIVDCVKDRLSPNNFMQKMKDLAPGVIGFQCFTCDAGQVARTSELLESSGLKATMVVGGGHPTGAPEESMKAFSSVDYGFLSEAEAGFPILVRRLAGKGEGERIDPGGVPGLIWRENGAIRQNEHKLIGDLDTLPLPAWDLMDPRSYGHAPQGGFLSDFPYAPLLTSRGCPHRCKYCSVFLHSGKKMRYRSIDSVSEELSLLSREYQVQEIHIIDDAFTLNKERVLEFGEMILERGFDFRFFFPNGLRLDTLDGDILDIFRRIGVYAFNVGVESGSQRVLDAMEKSVTLETIREKVVLARKYGIKVGGFFIIGYPTETEEDIERTIKFSLDIPLSRAQFSNFQVYPGTPITMELSKSGKLRNIDWSRMIFNRISYVPQSLTERKLKSLQRKAFIRFYLRPGAIKEVLGGIYSFEHFRFIVKRIFYSLFRR